MNNKKYSTISEIGLILKTSPNSDILLLIDIRELYDGSYYLLSAEKIVKNKNEAREYYSDYVDRDFEEEGVVVDDRIIRDSTKMRWLHFSDCMNNGGTSQLFIDFSPSESGKAGQIVMFVHDPDEIVVIADSFDEYLHNMVFDFITPDQFEC